ncbi:hypothetical protein J7I94_11915 [Streptomyces sp. ISL-12]|uniref:hypothetical protein n=1 Tax=Streptomyces sp. ISL-12 TaxID=2819177 RepID=UPI001BE84338|nr:hypothetical protein [Streptomyces sp. ISL-12]MBT2411264.1 hypothetical protein [Streptomyces sp. ISL-12]
MTDQRRTPEPEHRDEAVSAESEKRRAASRPFSRPAPERRPHVRATRHISREEADADRVPGVPGGYGTTGGGQPGGGRSTPRPHADTADESGVTDIVGGREPHPDRPNRSGGTDRE